jgi:hypothetical protein
VCTDGENGVEQQDTLFCPVLQSQRRKMFQPEILLQFALDVAE